MEQATRQRWIQALAEHCWDAISVVGPDGGVRYASPSLTRLSTGSAWTA